MTTSDETARHRDALEGAGFRLEDERRALPYPPGHVWHLTHPTPAVAAPAPPCPACAQRPCACVGAP